MKPLLRENELFSCKNGALLLIRDRAVVLSYSSMRVSPSYHVRRNT
jgi:hypothetical protein